MKFPLDEERGNSEMATSLHCSTCPQDYEASSDSLEMLGVEKLMYKFQTTKLKAEGLHDHQTTSNDKLIKAKLLFVGVELELKHSQFFCFVQMSTDLILLNNE